MIINPCTDESIYLLELKILDADKLSIYTAWYGYIFHHE